MNSFGAALIVFGMSVAVATSATHQPVAANVTADAAPAAPAPANPAPAPAAPVPASPAKPALAAATGPQTTTFSALDYFQTSCARCHGEYGMFYGDTFGKNLTDAKMHDVVRDMAAGPAQAPLEEKNLDVLVAWHRALRDKKPFVAVVKSEASEKGWTLSGEVSPDATLQLNGAAVTIEGHTWTATTPGKGPLQLQAKLGDKTTVLDALKAAYSAE